MRVEFAFSASLECLYDMLIIKLFKPRAGLKQERVSPYNLPAVLKRSDKPPVVTVLLLSSVGFI